MRYASDILYRWMRATGISDAQPDGQLLEVPPIISPVVSVPGPLRPVLAVDTAVVQRESFAFGLGVTRGASAAELVSAITPFGRGLWWIVVHFMHHADFTAAPGAVGGILMIRSPGQENGLIRFPTIANVVAEHAIAFPVLFPDDTYDLAMRQQATGAGQTLFSAASGIASRMN